MPPRLFQRFPPLAAGWGWIATSLRRYPTGVACVVATLVAMLCLWIPLSISRELASGDSIPYRYLPIAVVEHGTMRLDAFPELANPKYYAVVRDRDGHMISKKPALPGLLQIPAYLAYRAKLGGPPTKDSQRVLIGKVTMSIIGAAMAGMVVLMLWPEVGGLLAAAAGLGIYVLTPFAFVVLDSWPHAVLAGCNVVALWVYWRAPRGGWAWIGFFMGVAIASRLGAMMVALAFLAAAIAGTGSTRERAGRVGLLLLGAMLPLGCLFLYNTAYFGNPFSQGFGGQYENRVRLPFVGLAGLYFSNAKGILLYSPIVIFAFLNRWSALPAAGRLCVVAIVLHSIFWACYADWWGGHCYGPRYLSEVLPFMLVLVALRLRAAWETPRRWIAVGLAVVLAAMSFGNQYVAYWSWDGRYHQAFDRGWESGSGWAFDSPFETSWRLGRKERWWFKKP